MVLETIVKKLELLPIIQEYDKTTPVTGVIVSDMLSDVMAQGKKGDLWITSQTHLSVIAIMFFKQFSCLILPDGFTLDDDSVEKAMGKNLAIFYSSKTAFDVAGGLYELGLRTNRGR